jgi:hypothetical protein
LASIELAISSSDNGMLHKEHSKSKIIRCVPPWVLLQKITYVDSSHRVSSSSK